MPENRIFCHFCPNVPQKREDLGGRHNFFCICRLARLKIHVRGLLLYFQKNKKFLKLANFSRTCTPLKIENHEKTFFFSWFLILRGVQVLLKLSNFKNFLFFWKYNSKPLTCIFNLARRQIQKKLCRPPKSSLFLGTFGQKWQKMRFSLYFYFSESARGGRQVPRICRAPTGPEFQQPSGHFRGPLGPGGPQFGEPLQDISGTLKSPR